MVDVRRGWRWAGTFGCEAKRGIISERKIDNAGVDGEDAGATLTMLQTNRINNDLTVREFAFRVFGLEWKKWKRRWMCARLQLQRTRKLVAEGGGGKERRRVRLGQAR